MTEETITIRRAGSRDRETLIRLAGRDSAILPDDDFLIADVAGEAWAAIGLRTGAAVADPFRPSGDVAELLRIRARDMAEHTAIHRPPSPLRRRLARRAAA